MTELKACQERIDALVKRAEQAEAENTKLREALEYLADKGNYDMDEDGFDTYQLVRPGGSRHEGIILVSRHLNAWVYAEDALAQAALNPASAEGGEG